MISTSFDLDIPNPKPPKINCKQLHLTTVLFSSFFPTKPTTKFIQESHQEPHLATRTTSDLIILTPEKQNPNLETYTNRNPLQNPDLFHQDSQKASNFKPKTLK
ncbi:hypothetical protein Hdeb2414_s0001g00026621 [Helianthus debilis subsp. tardiflorus]